MDQMTHALILQRASVGQGHQTKASIIIVQKMSENCVLSPSGQFLDILRNNFSTFFGRFVKIPFSGPSNDLPVTAHNHRFPKAMHFLLTPNRHKGLKNEGIFLNGVLKRGV